MCFCTGNDPVARTRDEDPESLLAIVSLGLAAPTPGPDMTSDRLLARGLERHCVLHRAGALGRKPRFKPAWPCRNQREALFQSLQHLREHCGPLQGALVGDTAGADLASGSCARGQPLAPKQVPELVTQRAGA